MLDVRVFLIDVVSIAAKIQKNYLTTGAKWYIILVSNDKGCRIAGRDMR
jgi:hypothetical protein